MPRLPKLRSNVWSLWVFVIVAAGSVWAVYLWRFSDGISSDPMALAPSDANSSAVTGPAGTIPALRAVRPAGSGDARADGTVPDNDLDVQLTDQAVPTAAVTANRPPDLSAGIEMTLRSPEAVHPSVGGAPNSPPMTGDSPLPLGRPPRPRSALLESARQSAARGDLLSARRLLSTAWGQPLDAELRQVVRSELTRMADALLFSRATNVSDPLAGVHVVAGGDSLYRIAQRYHVTPELLAQINELADPDRLQVGQRIKVIHGPFHARILKSAHRMDVYLEDVWSADGGAGRSVLVRCFDVGLGEDGRTPTGTWIVNGRLKNPDWTDPITNRHYLADDPDNPIGERWLALAGVSGEAAGRVGFGIHGTIDASSIGRDASMGCIRLSAADVNLVYDLLVDGHSRVEILP